MFKKSYQTIISLLSATILLTTILSGCGLENPGDSEIVSNKTSELKKSNVLNRINDPNDQPGDSGLDNNLQDALCDGLLNPQFGDDLYEINCSLCCMGEECGLTSDEVEKSCAICPDMESCEPVITSNGFGAGTNNSSDIEFENCDNWAETSAQEVANWTVTNWSVLENHIEAAGGVHIKSCLKNRFESNGIMACEDVAWGNCAGNAGWALPLSKRIHVCPSTLNTLSTLVEEERRACFLSIMIHEFSHTCSRVELGAELIDRVAFDYYIDQNNINMIYADCGFM